LLGGCVLNVPDEAALEEMVLEWPLAPLMAIHFDCLMGGGETIEW
jgi:hypothetical protein